MRTGNVMLRFPGPSPVTREGLFERTRLCATAQHQYDRGLDIVVPEGVEIICFNDPVFAPDPIGVAVTE